MIVVVVPVPACVMAVAVDEREFNEQTFCTGGRHVTGTRNYKLKLKIM